jgi:hypothetical protein
MSWPNSIISFEIKLIHLKLVVFVASFHDFTFTSFENRMNIISVFQDRFAASEYAIM